MELDEEQNLILRATKFGIDNKEFTIAELKAKTNLSQTEIDFVQRGMLSAGTASSDNPNHLFGLSRMVEGIRYYTLLPQAFYNYVDYLEIKEARKQAVEARKYAIIAIWVSAVALFFGAGQFIIELIQMFKEWK